MRMKIKGLPLGLAVTVVTAYFALGMPHPVLSSAKIAKSPHASNGSPAAPGRSEGDDAENDARDDPASASARGHGRVVSFAAHCPITGPSHGVVVRSVASDPRATMADARSACASAMHRAAKSQSAKGSKKTPPWGPHGRSTDAYGKNRVGSKGRFTNR
jgi:hypothetical protein